MEQELQIFRNQLQEAFNSQDQGKILELLKRLKQLNIEIPFTVEIQDKPQ